MQMCKISVIIPVYNVECYLEQCLNSVLDQSFTEFEIICVDDCSTDGSLNILRKYAERDKRIQILQNNENKINMGPSLSRNKGVENARGKYIYMLDSDDWLMPEALQILWEKAEKYNSDVILFNSSISAEGTGLGGTSVDWNMESLYETVMTGEEAFSDIIERNTWSSAVWRQFWRKNFLEDSKIKFEDKTKAEDWIFTTETLLCAGKVVFINEVLHNYRRRTSSLSFTHDADMMKYYALNYMSMLQFWMLHDFSRRTNASIKIHMNNLVRTIQSMHVQFADVFSSEMFDKPIEQHLYELMIGLGQLFFLEKNPDKEFIDKLKQFKNIYIYGAAGYAIEMYEQLKIWNINVKGFVVTGFTKANSIYNLPVCRLEDICLDNDEVIFVLGITSKNRKDVIDNLEIHGFNNYQALEDMRGGGYK